MLRKNFTLRGINTTETDKTGLQPWTAVSPFLGLVITVQQIVNKTSASAIPNKIAKRSVHDIKFRTPNLLAPRITSCYITCFGEQEDRV